MATPKLKPVEVKCPRCNGAGRYRAPGVRVCGELQPPQWQPCPRCNGRKTVSELRLA